MLDVLIDGRRSEKYRTASREEEGKEASLIILLVAREVLLHHAVPYKAVEGERNVSARRGLNQPVASSERK
jgi:hypothetical protein